MLLHKPNLAVLLGIAVLAAGLAGCKDNGQTATETSGGSGPLSIHKMGGGIDVADAPHGATLETMGGGIHVEQAASFIHLKTMGGNITVGRAEGPLDATTMGGNISVSEAAGPVHATTMGGNISVRLVNASGDPADARRDVHLSSMGGAITLAVPKDFPMTVHVSLTYTRNSFRSHRIQSDIGLNQQTSPDWDYSHGSPRKTIQAEGRVGSGANQVFIDTINGDVILKQGE